MTEENKGLTRRTVVKGAAWSVPVIAVAVAAPARAASLPPGTDVRVTGICQNEYDISTLEALLNGVPLTGALTGPILDDLVKAALAALGINEGATRGFQIFAEEGTIPAGTRFLLEVDPSSLITLTALQELLAVQALFIADVNPQGFVLTTQAPIAQDTGVFVELQKLLLDADLVNRVSLTLLDPDQPTNPGTEAPDSGTITNLVGADVNLGTLNLGAQLETVLPGVLNATLRAAIQLLLGTDGGLAVLDGLTLQAQLCEGA